MKIQSILGLCLSGSLLFAGQAALADTGKEKSNNRSERALQVHIDKNTGQKIPEDDAKADSAAAVAPAAPASTEGTLGMPETSQAPVKHANGMTSVQLGQDTLKYMTMTINEDGTKSIGHESLDEIKKKADAAPAEASPEDKGLE